MCVCVCVHVCVCVGVAVVTLSEALLWTDGRYHLQASQQLDHNWTLMKQGENLLAKEMVPICNMFGPG